MRDLTAGTIDQVVVRAIVGISREMGKKTVAEFVESAEMVTFLRDNGVDCGQGYYLGPPQPVSEPPGSGHHRLIAMAALVTGRALRSK